MALFAFIELIKFLVKNLTPPKSALSNKEGLYLTEIHSILTAKDRDGSPLAYVPRSMDEGQKEMIKALKEITSNNMKQTMILERIEKHQWEAKNGKV